MSANLKDSNLQMLAVSSEMFAHSQHESPVCGLPLHCPYTTFYRMNFTLQFAKYINTLLSVGKYVCSSLGRRWVADFSSKQFSCSFFFFVKPGDET